MDGVRASSIFFNDLNGCKFYFCVEPSRKNLVNSMQKIIFGRRQICIDYSTVSVSLNEFSGVAASRCMGTTIEVSSDIYFTFTIEFRFIIYIFRIQSLIFVFIFIHVTLGIEILLEAPNIFQVSMRSKES